MLMYMLLIFILELLLYCSRILTAGVASLFAICTLAAVAMAPSALPPLIAPVRRSVSIGIADHREITLNRIYYDLVHFVSGTANPEKVSYRRQRRWSEGDHSTARQHRG